ncbi:MAG: enoyl-CoA hydratase/isomerase family protein [Firmicutes bacterium]|nr:enoyl-CoA hydratase/isomerase family protein [Bacillota bacterium]
METLRFDQEGSYGIIRFNRPEVLNAINEPMAEELDRLLDELEHNSDIRALILIGSERSFCAGADLKAIYAQQSSNGQGLNRLLEKLGRALEHIEYYGKPIGAAISGVAYGGGCEISLACDVRVAAENARIALSEVRLGVLPAGGGTQRLPRIIGLARAKQMMLSGAPIDAVTAEKWGLVDQVVPTDQLLQATKAFMAPFLEGAPLSQAAIKAAALAATNTDLSTGLRIERQWSDFLNTTQDFKEGVAAFNEKRAAHFQGR